MDNEQIYSILKEELGDKFIEVVTGELKFIDKYYIDQEKMKFVVICKVFEDAQELIEKWEYFQDEDIALKLQNKIFKNDDIRWDMYYLLIYKGDKQLDDLICYEIERDRFCCKKLIINAQSKILLSRDIKYKLPLTNIYSTFTGVFNVANDEYFLELINKKTNIDAKKVLEIFKFNK